MTAGRCRPLFALAALFAAPLAARAGTPVQLQIVDIGPAFAAGSGCGSFTIETQDSSGAAAPVANATSIVVSSSDFYGATFYSGSTCSSGGSGNGTTFTLAAGLSDLEMSWSSTSAGQFTLYATGSGNSLAQAQATMTVEPGPPAQLAFLAYPDDGTVGQPLVNADGEPVEVRVADQYANSIPGQAVTVSLDNANGATLDGTLTQTTDANGQASFPDLSIDRPNEQGLGYSLVASGGGLSAETSEFPVYAAVAQTVLAFQSVTGVAGSCIPGTISFLATDGGPTTPTGLYQMSLQASGGPMGVFSDQSCTAASGGVFSEQSAGTISGFWVASIAAGLTPTMRAGGGPYLPDGGVEQLYVSAPVAFTFTPGPLASALFTVMPDAGVAGVPLSPAPEVALLDRLGNLETLDSTSTVSIGNLLEGATDVLQDLAGDGGTVTAQSGVAVFPDLIVTRPGSDFTLVAQANSQFDATSSPFTIAAGSAEKLAFVNGSAAVSPGDCAPLLLQLEDSEGNPVAPADDVQVALAASPGIAQLFLGDGCSGSPIGSASIPAGADGGQGGQLAISFTAETQVTTVLALTASAPGLASASANVTVSAAPEEVVFTQAPTTLPIDTCTGPIVFQLEDGNGNVMPIPDDVSFQTSSGGDIQTFSDGHCATPGGLVYAPGDRSVTFSLEFGQGGRQTFAISANTIPGASLDVLVTEPRVAVNGWSCASAPPGSWLWLLVPAALFFARRRRRRAGLLLALVLPMLSPAAARAQPAASGAKGESESNKKKARAEFTQGETEYNLAHYQAALALFEDVYRLLPVPSILFNIAQCQRQLGELAQAAAVFRSYLRTTPPSDPNIPLAQDLLGKVDAALAQQREARSAPPTDLTPPPSSAASAPAPAPAQPATIAPPTVAPACSTSSAPALAASAQPLPSPGPPSVAAPAPLPPSSSERSVLNFYGGGVSDPIHREAGLEAELVFTPAQSWSIFAGAAFGEHLGARLAVYARLAQLGPVRLYFGPRGLVEPLADGGVIGGGAQLRAEWQFVSFLDLAVGGGYELYKVRDTTQGALLFTLGLQTHL